MTSKTASKALFLPGKTTDGHYQIELSCAACHISEFTTSDDFQTACTKCHAAELEAAHDSHPELKFSDPRNAERVALLDARKCVTCHSEHQPERTANMGLTLPLDYCYQCHQEIAGERASHVGLPFDSCANSGCHNFHDNRAIYEDYLVKHANEPPVLATTLRPTSEEPDCSSDLRQNKNDAAAVSSCEECHALEGNSWLSGRHGMRLAAGLGAMQPAKARLLMKQDVAHLSLNCGSCHGGDPQGKAPDARRGAKWLQVDSCLGCHDDEHSLAYKNSKHSHLFSQELEGQLPLGSGVTCATCHMPHMTDENGERWVNHNQNANLRPNEKMLRSVCSNCHGLTFALDALADQALLTHNFSGSPSVHVKSVDWAVARE